MCSLCPGMWVLSPHVRHTRSGRLVSAWKVSWGFDWHDCKSMRQHSGIPSLQAPSTIPAPFLHWQSHRGQVMATTARDGKINSRCKESLHLSWTPPLPPTNRGQEDSQPYWIGVPASMQLHNSTVRFMSLIYPKAALESVWRWEQSGSISGKTQSSQRRRIHNLQGLSCHSELIHIRAQSLTRASFH